MKSVWKTKKLGSISSIMYGHTAKSSSDKVGPKYLRITDIQENDVNWDTVPHCDSLEEDLEKYKLLDGDIVFARTGATTGKSFLIAEAPLSVFASYLIRVQADLSNIFAPYLYKYFQCHDYWQNIKAGTSGSAQGGFNAKKLANLHIPIPPLSEQKQIVKILDKAFTAIDQAKANIEQNIANAKELYESSLLAAVQGSLSIRWREKKKGDLKAVHDLSRTLEDVNNKRTNTPKKSEETKGHDELLGVMPREWQHTSVNSIFDIIDYRGKTPTKSGSGKKLITARNIKMGYISDEPLTFVSEQIYTKWMVRGYPTLGDIFFVTEGHTMGFVALNTLDEEFALAQRMITLHPASGFKTKFFFYYMRSPVFQKLVKMNATGAAAVGLKGAKLRSLPFPFPPFEEQDIIVKQLDALLEQTARLQSHYQTKLTSLEELKKSTLQKVFSGELT